MEDYYQKKIWLANQKKFGLSICRKRKALEDLGNIFATQASLFEKNVNLKLGDGKKIRFWEDALLPSNKLLPSMYLKANSNVATVQECSSDANEPRTSIREENF